MDSNRRHQLSQNALANWVLTQYEEWIQPNGNLLSWIVLVILVLFVAYFGSAKLSEWNKARAWEKYYTAIHSENAETELESLADTAKGSFADQARLTLAQIQLGNGCDLLFQDKTKATEQLEKALELFRRVEKSAKDAAIRLEAGFGLAQTWESLAAARIGKNDLTEAENEYKKIAEQFPNEFLGQKAKKQLALILRADTKKFFELAAAKVTEAPKSDDFKIEINKNDPFLDGPKGFDPQKAVGGDSILKNEFIEQAAEMGGKPTEDAPKTDAPQTIPQTTEQSKSENEKK